MNALQQEEERANLKMEVLYFVNYGEKSLKQEVNGWVEINDFWKLRKKNS